jgi:hypothetical protein
MILMIIMVVLINDYKDIGDGHGDIDIDKY